MTAVADVGSAPVVVHQQWAKMYVVCQTASTGWQQRQARYLLHELAVCRQQRRAMLTRLTKGGNARRLRLRTLRSLKRTMTATTRQE